MLLYQQMSQDVREKLHHLQAQVGEEEGSLAGLCLDGNPSFAKLLHMPRN